MFYFIIPQVGTLVNVLFGGISCRLILLGLLILSCCLVLLILLGLPPYASSNPFPIAALFSFFVPCSFLFYYLSSFFLLIYFFYIDKDIGEEQIGEQIEKEVPLWGMGLEKATPPSLKGLEGIESMKSLKGLKGLNSLKSLVSLNCGIASSTGNKSPKEKAHLGDCALSWLLSDIYCFAHLYFYVS